MSQATESALSEDTLRVFRMASRLFSFTLGELASTAGVKRDFALNIITENLKTDGFFEPGTPRKPYGARQVFQVRREKKDALIDLFADDPRLSIHDAEYNLKEALAPKEKMSDRSLAQTLNRTAQNINYVRMLLAKNPADSALTTRLERVTKRFIATRDSALEAGRLNPLRDIIWKDLFNVAEPSPKAKAKRPSTGAKASSFTNG